MLPAARRGHREKGRGLRAELLRAAASWRGPSLQGIAEEGCASTGGSACLFEIQKQRVSVSVHFYTNNELNLQTFE
ncbi:hypothetical protein NDU88_005651 [Pleurodeles waltl]|uniref:Uncharacterized protein n=1 Tax=Pleurodeles waltl TaxID=8319 RepID=A0AAV7SM93_PLEWA|nr:hypothetical protein NDU88_005651 [Pleurodeles waltl]